MANQQLCFTLSTPSSSPRCRRTKAGTFGKVGRGQSRHATFRPSAHGPLQLALHSDHQTTRLFARVGRQVEREDGEERDAHARDDEVHRVEQRLPPHRDVERDVQVRLDAASVEFLTSAQF